VNRFTRIHQNLLGLLLLAKHSLQKTGLPSVGLKGTSHSFPHSEQMALCISLGPLSKPPLRLSKRLLSNAIKSPLINKLVILKLKYLFYLKFWFPQFFSMKNLGKKLFLVWIALLFVVIFIQIFLIFGFFGERIETIQIFIAVVFILSSACFFISKKIAKFFVFRKS